MREDFKKGEIVLVWDHEDEKEGICNHAGRFDSFGERDGETVIYVRHDNIAVAVEWPYWSSMNACIISNYLTNEMLDELNIKA